MASKKEFPRRRPRNWAEISDRLRVFKIRQAAKLAIEEATRRNDTKFLDAVKRNPAMVGVPTHHGEELGQILDSVTQQQ